MASHAYSWNIIGWRHLTHAQFAYFGQAGHAILDEHDSQAAAFRPTARLCKQILIYQLSLASTNSSSSNSVQTDLVQLFVNCCEDHNNVLLKRFVLNK